MPILKNAKKALRASIRKAKENALTKQQMRSSIKSAKLNPSDKAVSEAFSRIDKAVKRGIIHKNKAARLKHQLSGLLNSDNSNSQETKSKKEKSTKLTKSTNGKKKNKSKNSSKKTTAA